MSGPGAYDLLLMAMSSGQTDLADPTVPAMRRNAEAAVRDDAEVITRHRFHADDLEAVRAVVAVGSGAGELQAAMAERLADLMGRPVWTVPGSTTTRSTSTGPRSWPMPSPAGCTC